MNGKMISNEVTETGLNHLYGVMFNISSTQMLHTTALMLREGLRK